MIDRPQKFCANRQFEWTMAVAMALVGLQLFFLPTSSRFSSFREAIDDVGMFTAAAIYFTLGSIRIVTLALNGKWPIYGPFVRAACSTVSAFIWAEMAFVLFLVPVFGAPSPYIWIYVVLTGSESYSTFRAVRDGLQ